jgi:hypothetical protein
VGAMIVSLAIISIKKWKKITQDINHTYLMF